jgi:hypothetical protein
VPPSPIYARGSSKNGCADEIAIENVSAHFNTPALFRFIRHREISNVFPQAGKGFLD